MDKLLVLKCKLPENRLYDLLRYFDTSKVFDVEVAAYIPPNEENMLALPSPRAPRSDGPQAAILKAATTGEPVTAKALAVLLQRNIKPLHQSLYYLEKKGLMSKLQPGVYRITPQGLKTQHLQGAQEPKQPQAEPDTRPAPKAPAADTHAGFILSYLKSHGPTTRTVLLAELKKTKKSSSIDSILHNLRKVQMVKTDAGKVHLLNGH